MFLRGTQLSQLSEEYETCMENVITTSKVIEKKKEALPDLRAALQKATDAFEEASKAREQRHKVDEIKKELAWAHVASKEDACGVLEMPAPSDRVTCIGNASGFRGTRKGRQATPESTESHRR